MASVQPDTCESSLFVKVPYDIFGRVRPPAIAVYAAFGRYANHNTGETNVAVETVAAFLGVDKKTVERGIRELQRKKWMKRRRVGLNKPSITTLRIPPKAVHQETPQKGALTDPSNRERQPHDFYNVVDFRKASA